MSRTSSCKVYPTLQTSVVRKQDLARPGPPRWDIANPSSLRYDVGRWYVSVEGRSTKPVEFRFIPGV